MRHIITVQSTYVLAALKGTIKILTGFSKFYPLATNHVSCWFIRGMNGIKQVSNDAIAITMLFHQHDNAVKNIDRPTY